MSQQRRTVHPPPQLVSAAAPAEVTAFLARAAPLVFVFLIAAVGYVNADHEEFLFDSVGQIDVPRTRNLGEALRTFARDWWRPSGDLTYVTFALNRAFNAAIGLHGFDVTTFLIVNVVIHAVNACLVYLLVRAMLGEKGVSPPLHDRSPAGWVPLAAAALFAVHPMHASSVVYIIQRRGALSATFYLLAVLIYLRVRRSEAGAPGPARRGDLLASPRRWPWPRVALAAMLPLCYWLSFKSKQLGLPLPLALLAIEFCLRAPDRRALKRFVAVLIPAGIMFAVAMCVYLAREGLFDPGALRIRAWSPERLWGPWTHFLTESRAFVHYWKLLLLPLPRWSCIDHDFALSRGLLEHGAVLAVASHAALVVLAVMAARQGWTLAGVGILWFYVALVPYIVLPQAELLVEYKTYLPSVGVALILADGLRHIGSRVPMTVQAAGVGVLAVLLLTTTIRRNVIYKSELALWSDAVAKSPNHPRPHLGLGRALMARGNVDEAIVHLRQAVKLKPDYLAAVYNLGDALDTKGDVQGAIEQFTRATQLQPTFSLAHNALGSALMEIGETAKAMHHYALAVRHRPEDASAQFNLATAFARQGDQAKAAFHFEQAIRADPNHAPAHSGLGNIYWLQGDNEAAARQYRRALKIDPHHAYSHRNLAELLEQQGQFEAATRHYAEAVRCRPEWWSVVSDRAWAYATHSDPKVRNPSRAVELAELVCRITGRRQPAALGALAAAYGESGRPDPAQAVAREAIDLASRTGQDKLAAELRARLQKCQTGGPSHAGPERDNP